MVGPFQQNGMDHLLSKKGLIVSKEILTEIEALALELRKSKQNLNEHADVQHAYFWFQRNGYSPYPSILDIVSLDSNKFAIDKDHDDMAKINERIKSASEYIDKIYSFVTAKSGLDQDLDAIRDKNNK